ncbi:MAG: hypothetical protein EBR30_10680 [Cytophagia bacterium]|nr:hypothetical protein [Cytophagia bacterium]
MSDEFFTKEDAKVLEHDRLFPEGIYPITITGCSTNDKDGKKWITIEATVCEGEFEGRKKWINLYKNNGHPNEKLWKWHLGIIATLDKALGLERMTPDSVKGQSCRMEITHSTRNDNTYDNVRRFLPL